MMRICTETGNIVLVKSVKTACEKVFSFNGVKRVLIEPCFTKKETATGVILNLDNSTLGFGCNAEYYVGNLESIVVEQILSSLTNEGYYDFSDMEFQNVQSLNDVVFDGGKSKPFNSERVSLDSRSIYICPQINEVGAFRRDYGKLSIYLFDEDAVPITSSTERYDEYCFDFSEEEDKEDEE